MQPFLSRVAGLKMALRFLQQLPPTPVPRRASVTPSFLSCDLVHRMIA